MNWTIEKKMFLVGAIILLGMVFIATNSYRTNRSTQNAWKLSSLRNEQMALLNMLKQFQTNLMLATMDSIIGRDSGKIEEKLVKMINENINSFKQHSKKLSEFSLIDQEEKWLKQIQHDFDKLSQTVQDDLKILIQESAELRDQVSADFAEMSDGFEKNGKPLEEGLTSIFQSVQEKQKEAQQTAELRNQQMVILNNMIRIHGNLMRTVLDATTGRSVGTLDQKLTNTIDTGVSYFQENIDKLAKIPDTDAEKEAVEKIEKTFPQLAESLQKDLVELIKKQASELKFTMLKGLIDAFGKQLEENLVLLFQAVQEKQKNATDQTEQRAQQITTLNDMIRTHGNLMLAAVSAVNDKDDGKIAEDQNNRINDNITFIEGNIQKVEALAETDQEKAAAENIQTAFPLLAKAIKIDLKNLIEQGATADQDIKADFAKIGENINSYSDNIDSILAKMTSSVEVKQREAAEHSSKLITGSTRLGLIIFLISIGIIVPIFIMISRSITKPLNNAVEVLTTGSEQVTATASQVSTASQSLADGASEQAASIEETSSSLEELASMTRQNADNAQQTNDLMKAAKQVIDEADRSMKQLTTSMDDISKASEETSKIINTIDEIAFQTNLLALNAAVEAARAGEAGSGFAVVADEVRNLAMRAADAAKNTSQLIEGTMKRIRDGSDLVIRTDEAFEKVAESTTKVGELVSEITVASSEQAQGIDQVNKTVALMDDVTQQVAANAEQSASASEEMNAQAVQLIEIVDNLKSLVKKDRQERKDIKDSTADQNQILKQPIANNTMASNDAEAKMEFESPKPQTKRDLEQTIPMDEEDFEEF